LTQIHIAYIPCKQGIYGPITARALAILTPILVNKTLESSNGLTSQSLLAREGHQMAPAVEELPSGQPNGHGRGPQPYRRQARRVRKIDFAQLDGLSGRAEQELRETEDALIRFIEAQEERDACT
jgi:hypothetical protein